MQRFYQLTSVRTPILIGFALHGIAIALIFFYLDGPWLQGSTIVAITLAAFREYRRLIQLENIRLRVNVARAGIEFDQSGQSYFYSKYKVYQTRWFAILKLIDRRTDRTLFLNQASFSNSESYRQMRFDLRRLERDNAA